MIPQPPSLPKMQSLDIETQKYLRNLDLWANKVYSTLRNMDIGTIKISSGTAVPTGGDDGDLYVRIAGASTALYLNKNGTFTAYNNP